MRRPWQIWLTFGLCFAVVLAVMGWMSLTAARLDRAQADARRQAKLEESVRLALWRMDSAVSPLIARESARPYFTYTAFYPAGRAYTRMFAEIESGEVLLPSPLLTEVQPSILLHFQFDSEGALTSPQVPTGNMRDLAEARYTSHEKIREAARRLDELRERVSPRDILVALILESTFVPEGAPTKPPQEEELPTSQAAQTLRSNVEWLARAQSQQKTQTMAQNEQVNVVQLLGSAITGDVMTPVWINGTLLLVRKVTVEKHSYIQGCWLNWPAIRASLLDRGRELLPDATLEPVGAKRAERAERRLAALPVRLTPGEVPTGDADGFSPIVLSLVVAWACVLLAAGAVAMLLLGAVSLSERRAAFVSAVTHELRTPLTTFRMYAEMLEGDMVTDGTRRKEYLGTLRTESERLGHLVENVLSYARLESGKGRGHVETLALGELTERVSGVLSARAAQADMTLVVEVAEQAAHADVQADTAAVEQILFNLVDNACKYAAAASDRRIHLRAGCSADAAHLRICDHGPGVAAGEAGRLFRAFIKSAREAAESAPGVGLGLALSRRLAREMNGDLQLDADAREGACFVLSLPRG